MWEILWGDSGSGLGFRSRQRLPVLGKPRKFDCGPALKRGSLLRRSGSAPTWRVEPPPSSPNNWSTDSDTASERDTQPLQERPEGDGKVNTCRTHEPFTPLVFLSSTGTEPAYSYIDRGRLRRFMKRETIFPLELNECPFQLDV
jgi:hypothetical protein